ncbi:MAG: redox-regulated ATPase YchF [Thermoleophilaceae bacterium]|nr:redox-regulated ATPase YchF [Thermoleophilaceae bacterium]
MKVGIVGLPNAGKSSLFNALTRAGAQAANYPFTTVTPNVAVVGVPDERLDAVVETIKATPTVYETIEFHDIAGLVRGAHEGEGLGNRFLANIRETDALVHVVRTHADEQVVHPEGRVDPATDVETIETELLYADLEQAERRLEKVAREAKSGDKEKVAEEAWLRDLVNALAEGRPARSVPVPDAAPGALRNLSPLTSKPVLYLANVGEDDPLEVPPQLAAHAQAAGARATAVSARIEAELSELEPEEAELMREDLGLGHGGPQVGHGGPRAGESGLDTVIREAWKLLGLITFFTAGEGKEGRAWAIREGTPARRAAGSIHTDIERGFVAAEVVSWKDLVETGSYAAARENAKLRVEGRDYPVRDGDVITVRFTP